MWIFLNDAFFSIVAPAPRTKDAKDGNLIVRARFPDDLRRVFGRYGKVLKITETPDRDYRYRAIVKRDRVAHMMAAEVERIDYTNFKASVPEKWRHDAYLRVWTTMEAEQQRRHSGAPGGRRRKAGPWPPEEGELLPF